MGSKPENRKICDRSIKLSWGETANSREISTQDSAENGMQETMSADLNATVLLVTYISDSSLLFQRSTQNVFALLIR